MRRHNRNSQRCRYEETKWDLPIEFKHALLSFEIENLNISCVENACDIYHKSQIEYFMKYDCSEGASSWVILHIPACIEPWHKRWHDEIKDYHKADIMPLLQRHGFLWQSLLPKRTVFGSVLRIEFCKSDSLQLRRVSVIDVFAETVKITQFEIGQWRWRLGNGLELIVCLLLEFREPAEVVEWWTLESAWSSGCLSVLEMETGSQDESKEDQMEQEGEQSTQAIATPPWCSS